MLLDGLCDQEGEEPDPLVWCRIWKVAVEAGKASTTGRRQPRFLRGPERANFAGGHRLPFDAAERAAGPEGSSRSEDEYLKMEST